LLRGTWLPPHSGLQPSPSAMRSWQPSAKGAQKAPPLAIVALPPKAVVVVPLDTKSVQSSPVLVGLVVV